jgi:phosphatidylglycerophosphatase A
MSRATTPDTPVNPSFQANRPEHWLAFGFGAGLSPVAPGTMGTLVAIPLYLLLANLPSLLYVVATVALIAAGVWACNKIVAESGIEDPPAVVWDEIVGFLVAMTAVPLGLPWIILGFLLFRLFDIYKPWPVSWVEARFNGTGFGIIADDLAAGAMTWVILQLMAMIVTASLGHGVAPSLGH